MIKVKFIVTDAHTVKDGQTDRQIRFNVPSLSPKTGDNNALAVLEKKIYDGKNPLHIS